MNEDEKTLSRLEYVIKRLEYVIKAAEKRLDKKEVYTKEEILQKEQSLIVDYPKVELAPTTHVSKHPLIEHKIDMMRDVKTKSSDFRQLVDEVTMLLCYEAMVDLNMEEYVVTTPICMTIGKRISGKKLTLAPIMRAGMGMESAAKRVVPLSRTGHVGLYRDEVTLEPQKYFWKMPKEIERREIFVLDPMLATGGSADAAISKLKEVGCDTIKFMCIIAAPRGVDLLQKKHPDVHLYIGHLDKGLNENGYIVPGLGDAGDRIFGTK